jgi:hypothetical protein
MGAIIAPLLVIVVLLVLGVVAVRAMDRNRMTGEDHAKRSGAETLRYHLPDGQDPVGVIAALHHQGFDTVEDRDSGFRDVLISCPAGKAHDRERARAVIEQVSAEPGRGPHEPAQVRFADE